MRSERERAEEFRPAVPRPRAGASAHSRSAERPARGDWSPDRAESRGARPGRDRHPAPAGPEGRRAARRATAPQRGIRGALGVLAVFLVTLAGAGLDSYFGVGLGTLTTVGLVASTVGAALVVRRRDLATVVVAPPLVFVGVAVVNIVLAPSATFSPATVATLLIRGFPAMAIAVAAALVLTAVRVVARR
ncbi:DUF6542 domain-containing protein [Klenkia sp. LSe6-5]|uniref:DUF6542 domain-containing protein n=1 Tax=Klenkia sesuvii TaxID=3103137 RepID=A0ABU8DPR5_9ACTN